MTDTIITIVYVLGWLAFVRPTARFCRDDMAGGDIEAMDVAFIVFFALMIPLFWPLLAVGLLFKFAVSGGSRDPEEIARKLGGESKDQKARRLEREQKEREHYITTLERELGIGQ